MRKRPLELWGGIECTVNRVGDRYRDQMKLSGHHDRPEDLDLVAALGVKRLRYPVLWERVAPYHRSAPDWRWSDDRLARIRALGMEPIVGLVHHGSGPRHTSLLSDNFAPLLGRYAAAVAERYPETIDWTPVNEPLTTARFSALYGHWYPHARDERLFWLALLNQIDATRTAMRAIRAVNTAARLIQTEDLGRCYATASLGTVAEFYNQRRWMTWDLLTGSVRPGHPLWTRLVKFGLDDRLRAIADDPCPPDVLGINHYITSDRFLDDRAHCHGEPMPPVGYHDVVAARVLDPAPDGLGGALREAWTRYRLPLAVAECHLNCTREEQVRWMRQAWGDCRALVAEGVDVRALTAWTLFGSFDWVHLLTREAGHYEPGAFDVRSGEPRKAAVGELLATLGRREKQSPGVTAALAGSGWWRRNVRLEHPPYRTAVLPLKRTSVSGDRQLLIAGATGAFGGAFGKFCQMRGLAHILADRIDLSPNEPRSIAAALDRCRPWAVINAASGVRVDDAEDYATECLAADADGAGELARACAVRDIHYTVFSSDLVFDGTGVPYDETSVPAPVGVDGHSKAEAERQATEAGGALVIRTGTFFSPEDPHSFAAAVEQSLRAGRTFTASPDPSAHSDSRLSIFDCSMSRATSDAGRFDLW